MFEISRRDVLARLGRFKTARGVVTTPTLLPVINPNKPTIPASEMRRRFGVEMVITNSYIIRKSERLAEAALKNGVAEAVGFDGPVMTDSGTFQAYVYGDIEIDNPTIVGFQRDIRSDVGTTLDIFTLPDTPFEQARDQMEETLRRADEGARLKGDMLLAATVQGGTHPELRRECARRLQEVAADVHPIGGVVPLMEAQRYRELVGAIVAAKRELDPSRPVHLFGAGHPMVLPMATLLGCDLFDSAAYAKYAEDDRLIFADGTHHLADLEELACSCPVCSSTTPAALKAMPKDERTRLLAEHNLHVTMAEVRAVRQAIREGRLWELAEERARVHPSLLSAFRELGAHADWLADEAPRRWKGSFLYVGPDSLNRPEARLYRRRLLTEFDTRGRREMLLLPRRTTPYTPHFGGLVANLDWRRVIPAVDTMFGPVPLELDETFPLAQNVEPDEPEHEAREYAWNTLTEFSPKTGVAVKRFDEERDGHLLSGTYRENDEFDALRLKATADMQFGKGAGDALFAGELRIVRSKNTGKIRNVYAVDSRSSSTASSAAAASGAGDDFLASMRAADGFLNLHLAGAERLLKRFTPSKLRVIVSADSMEFNRAGKSVFAHFVTGIDPKLAPGDEVIVVGPGDELAAVGELVLSPRELRFFKKGMAVKVREGIGGAIAETGHQ